MTRISVPAKRKYSFCPALAAICDGHCVGVRVVPVRAENPNRKRPWEPVPEPIFSTIFGTGREPEPLLLKIMKDENRTGTGTEINFYPKNRTGTGTEINFTAKNWKIRTGTGTEMEKFYIGSGSVFFCFFSYFVFTFSCFLFRFICECASQNLKV